MTQIGLPLDWPVKEEDDAFTVSACNRRVVQFMEGWGRWPVSAAILTGPRKSGRTLLGRIFVAKSGGTLADDAERYDEEVLFHHWNEAQDTRRPLFIIADQPPPLWRIALPDLASRLAATPCVTLSDPDEELVQALFSKLLKQRGLGVSLEVVRYLSARIARTYVNVIRLVDQLDDLSLSKNRTITTALAREALSRIGAPAYETQE